MFISCGGVCLGVGVGETPLPPLFVVLVGGGCGCGVLLAWVVGVVGGLWVEWEQMCDYH